MIRRDLPQVLDIERRSFDTPWDEQDFENALRCQTIIARVVECGRHGDDVGGFILYELQKGQVEIINIAVDPRYRLQGVGSLLVQDRKDKATRGRRKIILAIRERNLAGQLFFRANGFRAVSLLREFYQDGSGEDAYLLRWSAPSLVSR